MEKIRNVKILAIIAILEMLFASAIFISVNADEIKGQSQRLELIVVNQDIPLDYSFMNDVRVMLTNIIDDGMYWRGKQFGTPGERLAADNLVSMWDNQIAAGHSYIDNAIKDKVLGTSSDPSLDDYIGTAQIDDFNLKIYGIETDPINVIYPECSPIHTSSIKTNEFNNAIVHLVPDGWYSIFNLAGGQPAPLGIPGNTIISGDNDFHIYLIENKKLYDHTFAIGRFVDNILKPFSEIPYDDNPTANAFILADVNDYAHLDMFGRLDIPGISVNGSLGETIKSKINNNGVGSVTADFYLKTTYFQNVESYNVVGTINGEVDDIVIIGSHYDTVWGPCAADDAGSNSVVWGIAKYIADNEIVPYYTLKFIAWTGEEFAWRGSQSYIAKYEDSETWKYVITLGALGYKNHSDVPKIETRLNVWKVFSPGCQPDGFTDLLESFDYPSMSGGYGDILINGEKPMDMIQVFLTDGGMFAFKTDGLITLDKGTPSIATHWHHRTGENHTQGNTLDIIDEVDINASADVVLEIVMYIDEYAKDNALTLENTNCKPANR